MRQLLRFSFFLMCFLISTYSFAWGVLGHRIVGQIADAYLTDKARLEIKKILGNESVAMSSNWADFIKSDTAYRYLNNWHYINLDKGLSREEVLAFLKKDTATDVYTRINFLAKELKKKTVSLETKRMYLRLLIHFVGDVHQPLHVGRPGDRGGNGIKVQWFGENSNLHAVWDESLVNFQQLSYTEYAKVINFPTAMQKKTWQTQTPADWIADSYVVAQNIYDGVEGSNPNLRYEYNFKYVETVNSQLLKGGVHLAALLNSIFK